MKSAVILTVFAFIAATPLLAQSDLSVYQHGPRLARWQCMSRACAEGGDHRPTDCYANFSADKNMADQAICLAYNESTQENIQAVVNAIPGAKTSDIVQGLMMMRAIQGDSHGCEEGIKTYLEATNAPIDEFWTSALSGCSILAQSAEIKTINEE